MNMEKVHLIWDSAPDFDDWKDGLMEDYPDATEDELRELMYEINNGYLDDARMELSRIEIPNGICCLGDLGLWYGRRTGYPRCKLSSVSDCMRSFCDSMCETFIYVDEKGELRTREPHHDGTNYYWFRAYKPEVTEAQKERLEGLISSGQEQKAEAYMRRITYRLGDAIGDVYGWKFPNRPKASLQVA